MLSHTDIWHLAYRELVSYASCPLWNMSSSFSLPCDNLLFSICHFNVFFSPFLGITYCTFCLSWCCLPRKDVGLRCRSCKLLYTAWVAGSGRTVSALLFTFSVFSGGVGALRNIWAEKITSFALPARRPVKGQWLNGCTNTTWLGSLPLPFGAVNSKSVNSPGVLWAVWWKVFQANSCLVMMLIIFWLPLIFHFICLQSLSFVISFWALI